MAVAEVDIAARTDHYGTVAIHEASVPSTVDNSTISAVICSCLKR